MSQLPYVEIMHARAGSDINERCATLNVSGYLDTNGDHVIHAQCACARRFERRYKGGPPDTLGTCVMYEMDRAPSFSKRADEALKRIAARQESAVYSFIPHDPAAKPPLIGATFKIGFPPDEPAPDTEREIMIYGVHELPTWTTEQNAMEWIRSKVLWLYRHEAEEQIQIDGHRVFYPEGDHHVR